MDSIGGDELHEESVSLTTMNPESLQEDAFVRQPTQNHVASHME